MASSSDCVVDDLFGRLNSLGKARANPHPASVATSGGFLESESQRELDQPRAADRPARRADGRRACGTQGLCDLAKVRVAQVAHRVGKVSVIEQIKEVDAKLEPSLFTELRPQREIPGDREVTVLETRPVILIAP